MARACRSSWAARGREGAAVDSEIEVEYLGVIEQPEVMVVTVGEQGPAGRNGVDGASISPDPGNQLANRPNGLFVPSPQWDENQW